ncbi:hypothetical protein N9N28_17355 [Rubripirellula amarantea]|nr:hypothetical protein [Rubripirellula amarantea]
MMPIFRLRSRFRRRPARRQRALRRSTRAALSIEVLQPRQLLAFDVGVVADINTYPDWRGSKPGNFTEVGSTLFFTATTVKNGNELWKTDGTEEGTTQVTDIYSVPRGWLGTLGPNPTIGSNPSNLTNVGGTLYFSVDRGYYGSELWTSDGTATGTQPVKLIPGLAQNLNQRENVFSSFTNVGGQLFFTSSDLDRGEELWTSDGTADGTRLVTDVLPGTASSAPANLTDVDGTLYFTANDGTHGIELWISDGTSAGTHLVSDINGGSAWSSPSNLTNVDGTLYFTANDTTHGIELWTSDGTVAGTKLVHDINTGFRSSSPSGLLNVGGTLYFSAYDEAYGAELRTIDSMDAGTLW